MNVLKMSLNFLENLCHISKNKSVENRFIMHFSFDSSRMDIYVISVDRYKSGLLIDTLNVYVPYLVPEILAF